MHQAPRRPNQFAIESQPFTAAERLPFLIVFLADISLFIQRQETGGDEGGEVRVQVNNVEACIELGGHYSQTPL